MSGFKQCCGKKTTLSWTFVANIIKNGPDIEIHDPILDFYVENCDPKLLTENVKNETHGRTFRGEKDDPTRWHIPYLK